MELVYLILSLPIIGIALMAIFGKKRSAGTINIALTGITFLTTLKLCQNFLNADLTYPNQQFHLDAFSIIQLVTTTFIALVIAIFSKHYMQTMVELGKIKLSKLRLYHIMYQAFIFTLLLAFTTNNLGILWVSIEGATLTTALLVSLYRTPEAIEAAWKYFILCILGLALALLGTVLIYAAAAHIPAETTNSAMLWQFLYQHAAALNPAIMKFAFVFLLVGYGSKLGIVPLHQWLPDTYAESPAPVSALLSALLSNAALYALIRCKILVDITLNNHLTGNLLMSFGLLSFIFGAVLIYRQRNIKRLFSYTSIEHIGLTIFAIGLGGTLATYSGLLAIIMHALAKATIFITVGKITLAAGTKNIEDMRGLLTRSPALGWTLLISAFTIAGFPPGGVFTSEFMLIIATMQTYPWVVGLLILGLIIALAGIMKNTHTVAYGDHTSLREVPLNFLQPKFNPAWILLGTLFVLGIYQPAPLANLLSQATILISGKL